MKPLSSVLTAFLSALLVGLFASTIYLASKLLPLTSHPLLQFAICLLPMLPATIGLMLCSGRLRGLDEMAMRINLEAATFGLLFTAIAGFALGLQQILSPDHAFNAAWAVPIAGLGWIVGTLYSRQKFL